MTLISSGMFTGKDNETMDLGRVLWAVSVVAMIAFEGIAIFRGNQPFNSIEFAGGLSAILLGGGGGIALKAHTEPGASN